MMMVMMVVVVKVRNKNYSFLSTTWHVFVITRENGQSKTLHLPSTTKR